MPAITFRLASTAMTETPTVSLPALPILVRLSARVKSAATGAETTGSDTSKLMERSTEPLLAISVSVRLVVTRPA